MFRLILILTLICSFPTELSKEPEAPYWCFFGEYESLDAWDQTKKPPRVYIEMNYKKLKVFIPCHHF